MIKERSVFTKILSSISEIKKFAVLCSVRIECCMKGSAQSFSFPCSISGLILVVRYSEGNTSYCHYQPSTNISFMNTFGRGPGYLSRYSDWLDGQVSNPVWGRDFPHPSRPAVGPTQPPIQWLPGLSRG
jgi:hypothetical protein